MSWDLCRGGLKHDEIGLVHPRVSFTSPKSLVPNIISVIISVKEPAHTLYAWQLYNNILIYSYLFYGGLAAHHSAGWELFAALDWCVSCHDLMCWIHRAWLELPDVAEQSRLSVICLTRSPRPSKTPQEPYVFCFNQVLPKSKSIHLLKDLPDPLLVCPFPPFIADFLI